jgi:hypothetical protein
MRPTDTTHKKQSMHVKVVPAMGTYLPKKSMNISFFVPAETLIAVKLLNSIQLRKDYYNKNLSWPIWTIQKSLRVTQMLPANSLEQ